MRRYKGNRVSKALYGILFLLLVTYFVFPSFYIGISQRLFTFLYTRNALVFQKSLGVDLPSAAVPDEHGDMVPLHVIARPPQTPYDFLIVRASVDSDGEDFSRYVYNDSFVPVGYIERQYPAVYIITLFSAPKSREQFSIGTYVAEGLGEGGGSFSFQIPSGIPAVVGMPIVHQVTGMAVGTVAVVNDLPEKKMQEVVGVLHSSPFEMAVLYARRGAAVVSVTGEAVDVVIQSLDRKAVESEEGSNDDASGAVSADGFDEGGDTAAPVAEAVSEEDAQSGSDAQVSDQVSDTGTDSGTNVQGRDFP